MTRDEELSKEYSIGAIMDQRDEANRLLEIERQSKRNWEWAAIIGWILFFAMMA